MLHRDLKAENVFFLSEEKVDYLVGWLNDWLIDWLIDYVIDWLIN